MASAIWSATPDEMMSYPAAAFVRFHDNHGLLQLMKRPAWESVIGGSRNYVVRLADPFKDRIRLDTGVREVQRMNDGVIITDLHGRSERYDHVVLGSHADQSLKLLADPSAEERNLLGDFRYSRNLAVLHTDDSFMPKRRAVWSNWNYIGSRDTAGDGVCVTYWMNRLQNIDSEKPLFVTLNPPRPPRAGTLLHSEIYHHPIFDANAMAAQRKLWLLQGRRNTWFCGSYFGSGFHEDGLQAGLAVAEQLGGVRRPWTVPNESGRIVLTAKMAPENASELLT
jgi:predicted NAD/FAD-binding protein